MAKEKLGESFDHLAGVIKHYRLNWVFRKLLMTPFR